MEFKDCGSDGRYHSDAIPVQNEFPFASPFHDDKFLLQIRLTSEGLSDHWYTSFFVVG